MSETEDLAGDDAVYEASPIKRHRSTRAEVRARRVALLDIISAMRPMTVRQAFYQATVAGLVEKSEAGYSKVQVDLTVMRKMGILPYDWYGHAAWPMVGCTSAEGRRCLRSTSITGTTPWTSARGS